eukprot:NODE_1932_length_1032_cov_303.132037.p1 GENE.NODE_1932_length_1032_cov_303.132037~~NODE_1932_length_1032_cov_303.132037.p1  ORF type:complete len:284 (+),score=76.70 NODE_1932_length_1032_cov_303.132037:43-852(+)
MGWTEGAEAVESTRSLTHSGTNQVGDLVQRALESSSRALESSSLTDGLDFCMGTGMSCVNEVYEEGVVRIGPLLDSPFHAFSAEEVESVENSVERSVELRRPASSPSTSEVYAVENSVEKSVELRRPPSSLSTSEVYAVENSVEKSGVLRRPPSSLSTSQVYVNLKRTPDAPTIGLELCKVAYERLGIKRVVPGMLMAEWNDAHPSQEVQRGDYILSVNDVCGDSTAMLICLKKDTIRILVERVHGVASGAGAGAEEPPAEAGEPSPKA